MKDEVLNQGTESAAAEAPAVTPTELDGLSEFTFQGEKLTPDQLHRMMNEHKSYSERASSYEQNKQYVDNLDADIENVLNDPRLADRFKQTYPKMVNGINVHQYLDRILSSHRPSEAPQPTAQTATLPKEFLNEFGELKRGLQFLTQDALNAKTEAAGAKLDAILPKLYEKYHLAVNDVVLMRAERFLEGGGKLTDQTWERFARESHAQEQKKFDQYQSAQLKTQLEKGRRSADTGPGGATPGQAPVKPRSFEEAHEAMLKHVQSQRNG